MNFLFERRGLKLLPWLLILVLYFPSFNGPYILDDSHTVQGNAAIQNPSNIFKIWTSGKYYSSSPDNWGYRPVTTSTNMLCWWIGGGATWPFHLLKILLFAGLCSLLADVWRRLLSNVSPEAVGWGLVLFAANPVHTQVVSYISATSTLLAAVFAMLAMQCYLKWRQTGHNRHLFFGYASLFLAMLSKEEGIVMIALVPLTEIYLRLRSGDRWNTKFPVLPVGGFFFAAGIAIALIVWKFEPSSDLARGYVSRGLYFLTQCRAYFRYLLMFWVPVDLNADNLEFGFSTTIKDPMVIAALIGNLVLIGFALASIRKRPLFALIIGWFYIAISPASSVVPLAEPVNDHRAFIAYFCLLGLNIFLLDLVWRKNRRVALTLVLTVLIIYSIGTFRRNQVWGSNEALWLDTVAKNPSSPRALNNLAVDYMSQGRMQDALDLLEKCRVVGSRYGMCYINRAVSLAALGRDSEAEVNFSAAVSYDLTQISARIHWAQFLKGRGLYTRALGLLKEADLAAHGQNFAVRADLIQTYAQAGDFKSARLLWQESIPMFGKDSSLYQLGNSLGFAP